MKALFRAIALLGIAMLTVSAAPKAEPQAGAHWLATIAATKGGGHLLGNPDAKLKLIAWESYTCHFCHAFETEAAAPIRLAYISTGKVSLEVRHIIRDPIDLTAAMLTECVPKEKFFDAHRQLYLHFDKTLDLMANHTQAQVTRWNGTESDRASGRRAIAEDFGFYDIFEQLGMSRAQMTQCVNDDALAHKLANETKADSDKYGITGTPSFALDGTLLIATHSWDLLQPQIDARL
jgi:protein-disulfide isomerase